MNKLEKMRLDAIHDVRCPRCGAKASWRPTAKGYETLGCHDELFKLIEEREKIF